MDGLTLALRPVEPFLISGVPGVFEARNQHLSPQEWGWIKDLPRDGKVRTLKQHAEGKLGQALLKGLQPNEAIYLEALSRDDVIPRRAMWHRTANSGRSNPPKIEEDSAQAYFLTRVVDNEFTCTRAAFTVAWAAYFDGRHMTEDDQTCRESLTPRYLSAPLLASEIETLPPLVLA